MPFPPGHGSGEGCKVYREAWQAGSAVREGERDLRHGRLDVAVDDSLDGHPLHSLGTNHTPSPEEIRDRIEAMKGAA